MLVKIYALIAFISLVVMALGLFGVLDGEQCLKAILGMIGIVQGLKGAVVEHRTSKEIAEKEVTK